MKMRFWNAVGEIRRVTADQDLDLIAAGVAFYGIFSIFPGVAALISLFGLIADPTVVDQQLQILRDIIPKDAFALIDAQVGRLLLAGRTTLGWTTILSIGIAMWSARAGVGALMRGINSIFGGPMRGGLRHIIVALFLTVILILVAIVALVVVVLAPIALALVPMNLSTVVILEAVRWFVGLSVILTALGLLYRYAPNKGGERIGWISPGAFVTLILWFAASWGFSTYLGNFGRYNEIYGSIGAVIALLMWLYISAYLILVGAVLNVALLPKLLRRGNAKPDSPGGTSA